MKISNLIAFAGGVVAGGIMALMFAPKKELKCVRI